MSNTVTIELTSNAEEIARSLGEFPQAMAAEIARALDTRNQATVGYIVDTKLTNAGPQFLNRRTSTLARSIRASKAVVSGRDVSSSIGSNVRYAGVHEFGFKGTVNVPGFVRKNKSRDQFNVRGVIVSRSLAQAFGAFNKRGQARAGVSQTSSSVSFVRAHTRKMNLPARAMVFTGISEKITDYSTDISDAIVRAWEAAK